MQTACVTATHAAPPCARTRHANRRAQQRSIPTALVDLVLDYGERCAAGGGAEIVRLTERSRHELAMDMDRQTWRRHAHSLRTVYAVVAADGVVITLGHRFRRVERR